MPNCQQPDGSGASRRRGARALVEWSQRARRAAHRGRLRRGSLSSARRRPRRRSARSTATSSTWARSARSSCPRCASASCVCPRALRPVLIADQAHAMDLGTSLLLQHVLAEFLERGYLRAHLNTTLPEYRARRDALEPALARHLPRASTWRRPERGLVLWLPLPTRPRSRGSLRGGAAARRARRPERALRAWKPRAERGLRLTFCAEPRRAPREGARRLGEALRAIGQATAPPGAQAVGASGGLKEDQHGKVDVHRPRSGWPRC